MAPLAALLVLNSLAADVTVRLYWQQGGPQAKTIKVPLEEYVASVLAGEAAGMRSPESLKAMAVAARTYALKFKGRHAREGFDFCDTTHCQDYRRSTVNEAVTAAAEATEGELLWYRGALVAAYYSAHCGGMSEASPEGPYLNQHRDPWCLRQQETWRTMLSREEIQAALKPLGLPLPPMFTQMAVVTRTPSNRAVRLNLSGAEVDAPMFGLAVGRLLGWDRLPSGWYDVAQINGQFVFAGRGRGHGIGLCQAGCARMGEQGKTYREILQFAYPGTTLGLNASGFAWQYNGGERVDVFTTTPDALLVAATDIALREAEQASGIVYRSRPRLRVYPNLAAYRNATGESGAIAATTRGGTVRMQPPEMLRARHVLESTLRHEMLHVVLESVAAGDQPWWFREGLVLALNNERPADPRYRAAADRVNALLARFGRETVFGYWRNGLSPEAQVEPRRVQQQPSPAPTQQKAGALQRQP